MNKWVLVAKRVAFLSLAVASYIRGKFRSRRLIVYYADPFLARRCEALNALFCSKGLPSQIVSGLGREVRIQLWKSDDLWVGFWNVVPLEHLPQHYVFWNAEPLEHSSWSSDEDWVQGLQTTGVFRWHESAEWRQGWKNAMLGAEAIWGYRRNNEAYVRQLGKPFTFVPFGYSPYYEAVFEASNGGQRPPQEIEVLFVGWLTDRRKVVINQLREMGVNVVVVDQHNPLVGEPLERLMARAQIYLGIFCYSDTETHAPDLARFDFLFSNRLFALHERPSASGRDADFEAHVPVCDYENLASECVRYLRNPGEREAKAGRVYDWFKATYPLESFVPVESLRALLK